MAYTIKEVAEILNVSPKTVRRKVRSGEIPSSIQQGKYGTEYVIEALPSRYTLPVDKRQGAQSFARPVDTPTQDVQALLDMIDRLQKENIELAQRMGYYQSAFESLQAQVKLLETPINGRSPWWKRLLNAW